MCIIWFFKSVYYWTFTSEYEWMYTPLYYTFVVKCMCKCTCVDVKLQIAEYEVSNFVFVIEVWGVTFCFIKVLELPGRFWWVELHQISHSDCSLRGLPQVPQLPYGLQVFPQRAEPHQHAAPDTHRRTGQVWEPASTIFSPCVEKYLRELW